MYSAYKVTKQGDDQYTTLTYSFLSFEPVCHYMSGSNCCFLTCIQTSQEAGKMVWYSYLLKNFTQFVVIYTVKGFSVVNEGDVFSGILLHFLWSNQFSSVTQSCPTLCNPMNCSTPGLPVQHQLRESTKTHVHRVGDTIQPCPQSYLRLLRFLPAILIPACASSSPAFLMMYSAYKLISRWQYTALMYSFSCLKPVCCPMSSSNCCFLTCIQVSQQAVWYSHLFKNFLQFIVIHTVKGFGIVIVGNLISGSSAFSKSSLNIWKFSVHVLPFQKSVFKSKESN